MKMQNLSGEKHYSKLKNRIILLCYYGLLHVYACNNLYRNKSLSLCNYARITLVIRIISDRR